MRVLLLLTHQPGNVHTTKKPIRGAADMKGLRIRFSSPTVRDFVSRLGGTAVGVQPNEQLEQLQKGVIDGTFIDYGGAGVAFKMGGTIKYSTEMYSYVSSFGIGMNPDFYARLPAELKKLIDQSVVGVEKEVGAGWDALDDVGKKLLVEGGAQPIKLSSAENRALPQGRRRSHRGQAEGARGEKPAGPVRVQADPVALAEVLQDLAQLLELTAGSSATWRPRSWRP
jgi:TRAP-type C4-dicarboxylate transport system substrate-binding protein